MKQDPTYEDVRALVLSELDTALSAVDPQSVEQLMEAVLSSRKVFFVGVGRVLLSLEAMAKRNEEKAKILYDFLDQSKMFRGTVDKEFRSLMNVPFVTESKELDAEVVKATKAAGYDNLKGHKSVGGLRASIYNAMPKDGVEALVSFLRDFEANHK